MNKKLIKLTESDLHRIVKESVNKVLLKEDSDENVYNQVKMLRDRFDNIYRNSDYLKPGYEELVGGEDIQNAYFKVQDAFSNLLNIYRRMGIDSYTGESFGGLG
jgi:hypothetical protein